MCGSKTFGSKTILGQKSFGSEEIWSLKKFGFKKFPQRCLIKTNFGQMFGPERIGSKEVGSKNESKQIWSKKEKENTIWSKKIWIRKNLSQKIFV